MNPSQAEALKLIFGRRSVRVFRDAPVEPALVETLLQAAMAAPSAVAKDPWRFVVIRSRERLAAMARALPNGEMQATAALSIVVCGDLRIAHDQQVSYLLQDCAAAIENLLLAAHGLGLGACWLGIHPREARMQQVATLLALPSAVIPVAAIALGWPGETKEPRTRYHANYVHAERWAAPEGTPPA